MLDSRILRVKKAYPMIARFVVFIGIALGLLAAIHYYLWLRLARDPHWPSPWGTLVGWLLVVAAVGTPAAAILSRGKASSLAGKIAIWSAYTWLGVMFLLFTAVLAVDIGRLIIGIARRITSHAPIDADRRTFVARIAATTIAAVVAGASALAVRSALSPIEIRRVRVRLARLPRAQHGLTIAQITDLHVGPTIGRAVVEDVVNRTNALGADLIAITGDLVDGSVGELREAVAPLANLRARHGVFFVTGNHEYFSGADAWMHELSRLGIRVLGNERVSIGEGDASFDLGGIEDRSAHRYGGLSPEAALARALEGRDPKRELVLLAHQPRSMLDAVAFGVGLQISGHTHGGQIWPFGYLVRLQQRFWPGLHRHGDAQIYVSRGTGYWGPPMRLAEPAEITHLTLESEQVG
jgi:predicted MPP superfamily phosphohydrolase